MDMLKITAGPYTFRGRFEDKLAPKTCAKFRSLLPYEERIIHVRWSGEACWIPLGELDLGLSYENHTSFPAPGQIIVYPGGISETEILIAYGGVRFASKVGQLAGNHFITIADDLQARRDGPHGTVAGRAEVPHRGGLGYAPNSSRKRSIWCMRACRIVTMPISPFDRRRQ